MCARGDQRRGLLGLLAFDLLQQDGVDLRSLSLIERQRDLNRLCRQSHTPFLKQVESFPLRPLQPIRVRGCVHRLEHRADHRFVLDHPVGVCGQS